MPNDNSEKFFTGKVTKILSKLFFNIHPVTICVFKVNSKTSCEICSKSRRSNAFVNSELISRPVLVFPLFNLNR